MSPFTVPVVDISPYVDGGGAEARARVAREIDQACREVGFIQIRGHGIPTEAAEGLAGAIDDFFAMSPADKSAWVRPSGENRGYTPPKSESLELSLGVQSQTRMKDFFEAFNVGSSVADYPGASLIEEHYAANTWPTVPGFQARVDIWRSQAARVARVMVQIFEDALDLPRGTLADLAKHPIEVLRMNNYALPAGTSVAIDEDLTGMGAHTDYGIVTLLWADQVSGLQVLHDGGWHDVSPADGALLINLGDLTTRLTNEQWLSTLHRVKPPIVGGTIERRRSAAFFFDADAEAVVGPLPGFVDDEHPRLYDDVTVDEHVRAKLAGSRAGVRNSAAEREALRVLSAG